MIIINKKNKENSFQRSLTPNFPRTPTYENCTVIICNMKQSCTFTSWNFLLFTEYLVLLEPKLVITEIELKKRTHLSEASWQKYGKLPSKEVVDSFVKVFGCENKQEYLVRYNIQYSVTLSSLYNLVYFPSRSFSISKFQQSGHFSLPPLKDWQCLFLPNWERLPIWDQHHE